MMFMMHYNSMRTVSRCRGAGFTMIEVIITMSIVTILLAIGVPAFKYVTSANRASSEVNGLLGDLQFARAEAIREGVRISVCASNGLTCSGSTSWQTGWIVFTDNSGVQGVKDGTDVILKIQDPFSGGDILTADQNTKSVTFSRDGFAIGLPAGSMVFTLKDPSSNAQYTRCLSATLVGALSTQIGGKTTAEGTTC